MAAAAAAGPLANWAEYGVAVLAIYILFTIIKEVMAWQRIDQNQVIINNNTEALKSLSSSLITLRETQIEHTVMLKSLVRKGG